MSYSANSTGGEFKHTLSINEMPSHSHDMTRSYYTTNGTHKHQGTGGVADGVNPYSGKNTLGVSSTGGSNSHNNIQPYITVFFWRRTA